MAAKFSKRLGKNRVIVVEPADVHYYQPMFTLVGGGLKKLQECSRPMSEVLPDLAHWIKDKVVEFDPSASQVRTKRGDIINYDFMIVATGLELNYEQIPGLVEGLELRDSGVCSNYSPRYTDLTYKYLQSFQKGNIVFTFPKPPVKCPGAPQKIVYLAEDYLQKNGKRQYANLIYNSALPVLFGVKKYADSLWKVVERRNIEVNLKRNLLEVRPHKKEAIFEDLDEPGKTYETKYSVLHVTPPQSTGEALKNNADLTDAGGFLELDKATLRHVRFSNIYGIGDCTNLPTSKTAAAVAAQCGILRCNLGAALSGETVGMAMYDGYTSCPLVTGNNKCILAEFDYNLQPLETFPMNQGVESTLMYTLKAHVMPEIYWRAMLNGFWEGPSLCRKALHLGMGQ
uniref:Sulfide:quinone oxidoreductase, mitochondrial n=1 Tax=Timema poppense TaxID=170557 RepID=A0A7R9DEV9_TIMPO|nr:unnamed protein product [Timema poppensis]